VRDLESRFAADAEDPSGGPPAELRLSEVAIGDAMAPTGIAPSELKVDCKSSMCRVQGVFDNPGNAQDWGMFYLSAAGGELASSRIISQRRPDGSVQLSIYGTRGEPPR
jgi:hypothetical protein